MSGVPRKHLQAWRDRFQALQNIPPVLVLLWESGRLLVTGSVVLRTLSAIVPVSLLWVTKLIVDAVVAASKGTPPPGGTIFRLLAAQFALAAFGVAAGRGIDYLDARIADEYSRTASLRIMRRSWILRVSKTRRSTTCWSGRGCRRRTASACSRASAG